MTSRLRLRLMLLVAGAGALMTGVPCSALTSPDGGGDGTATTAASVRAMSLLEDAAWALHARAWSGTQHVVSVRDGQPSFTVLQLQHTPGAGSAVRVLSSDANSGGAVAPDALDARLLRLLGNHYDLRVAGTATCAGRPSFVVEARRPGQTGAGAVAGRFWVDTVTHLVLRREVLDETGSVIRTSAFVALHLDAPRSGLIAAAVEQPLEPVRPTGRRLDDDALRALEADGWPVVHVLPSGLELFESRLHERDGGEVLQLSYSDGLSTLSLFVQQGELATEPAGTAHAVGGGTVWMSRGTPERVVWSGEGRTWTLMSDAPAQAVADAVLVLPHTQTPIAGDSVGSRAWRGMSRVGAWLNPFA